MSVSGHVAHPLPTTHERRHDQRTSLPLVAHPPREVHQRVRLGLRYLHPALSLDQLLAQLDPKKRGPEFERLCRWYLANAPEYRGRFKHVWLWREWPDAWGPDAGIDLVAEEHDGGLWAIQAKAYDPAYAIKKADVDSFLSESSRPGFSYRLLIATTDRLGPTAKRTLDAQREPVGYLLRSQLALAPVEWPASPDELRPRRPARKTPFPHVREAIQKTARAFKDTDRGQLLMACGTGKTLAAMWIAERLDSTRTLVLLPSLSLLGQTLREWSANASKPFDYLAVCSDETVIGEDRFVQHTSELALPVTTDPKLIAAFLRQRGRRVVFATYQSSPQITAAFRDRTPGFDLAVADEAHRCAGRVGTEFTAILDRERIHARRRLFMTATPRYYTPRLRREAGELAVEVASMDDEDRFGPVLHRLTFGEAIERKLLSDYQVVVVGVTDSMYRRWAEQGEFVTLNGKRVTDARSLAGQIGLAKTMHKYDLERIVSFHSRVAAARRFADELPAVIDWLPRSSRPSGSLWAEHVSGTMSSGVRDARLRQLRMVGKGERGLLSNARCLGEGVDVPTLDGVAFIDPRRSTIDIIQALGRAIRKAPDKKVGTIVIPVFVDEGAHPEEALASSAFKHVWDVLKALRAHDEQLAEELDELRRRLGALRAPPKRPQKIELDVSGAKVGDEFAKAFDARLVKQTTAPWEFYFGLLERFVEQEGHARVPENRRENGSNLGGWVRRQRRASREGSLDPARRTRLEALPGWAWNTWEADWEEGIAHLERFVGREGHARVPIGFTDGDFKVGRWVAGQRQASRRGQLDPVRRARLEGLPGWVWNAQDAAWEDAFAHLERFVEREGHARVPNRHIDDGFKLGGWVTGQRHAFRRGKLDPTRRTRLEALPSWVWRAWEASWEDAFAHLERFVEREGHARVPGDRKENGFELGAWVTAQRQASNRGTLDPDRRARLGALPGWVWRGAASDAAWEDGFAHLQRFVAREGHARVASRHNEDGYPLGQWASTQRWKYKRGDLASKRSAQLAALPSWTWSGSAAWDTAWDEAFTHLQRYVEREGHARVPAFEMEDGYKLGQWVSVQRKAQSRGALDANRRARLAALPGWVWDSSEADWEEGFAHLETFVERESHARVPQAHREDGYKLGQWVGVQRRALRKKRPSDSRRARLEALPGWAWNTFDARWEEGFAHLQTYVKREGHARVTGSHREDGYNLGQWVTMQRASYRRRRLTPERRTMLEATSGWIWDPSQAAWEEAFGHLRHFLDREGHPNVPQAHREGGYPLGQWVSGQRRSYKRGSLESSRQARLEALPGWTWDARKKGVGG
jgi:superfamily II DNA or RNA helicase